MNKNTIIIVVVIVAVILGGVWWWLQRGTTEGQPSTQAPSDTTGSIQTDLNNLDLGDLDKEFQNVDADLNSL